MKTRNGIANGSHSPPVAFSKPPRVTTAPTVYPVTDTLPCGRRRVAVTSKGTPAPDVEHSTGFVCHPDDIPNHQRCHDCKQPPEQGRSRCARCAEKHRRIYHEKRAKGQRWMR